MKKMMHILCCVLALACSLALAACTGESGRSMQGQQQGVSDVMQAQMEAQASSDADDNASVGAQSRDFSGGAATYADADVDFDLTAMSAEMVYATVNDMLMNPNSYEGCVVRMDGIFYHSRDDVHNIDYNYVIVQDATACCAQGLEFVWGDGSHVYPDDYPADGEMVLVTGVFETYTERAIKFVHIVNADFSLL